MSVVQRTRPERPTGTKRYLALIAATAAMAVAGCSASITRFDNPSFALGEGAGTGTPSRRSGGTSIIDSLPPASAPDPLPKVAAATRAGGGSTEVASLPAVGDRAAGPSRAMAVTRQPMPADTAAPAAVAAAPAAPARGQTIEVRPGDTLYAIGKRHNVLISDLMAANDLRSPNLKPGQRLYLPAAAGARPVPQVRPDRQAIAKAPLPATSAPLADASAAPAAAPGQTYTVKPGDSLYAIAARHKIKVLDLQRANNITDARKVKPGAVLVLPDGSGAAPQPLNGETVQPETRIVRMAPPGAAAAPHGVKLLNGGGSEAGGRMAAVEGPATATDAPPAPAGASSKLRWPARGRVVHGFGPRPDGSHNDGVDIAVPAGTDVLAAENGVVAYAGNEVKTYGNLVLIRHDNGWVTAYANNEKLLVQRGDRVKRGQPIAKAGRSGTAEQPQVHFEVRVGAKPVDPTGYLEKL